MPMSSSDPRRPRGDPRTTNRQDSTGAAVMAASSISRIKKIFFWLPRKCPICLFGPLANRMILERLQDAVYLAVCKTLARVGVLSSCPELALIDERRPSPALWELQAHLATVPRRQCDARARVNGCNPPAKSCKDLAAAWRGATKLAAEWIKRI